MKLERWPGRFAAVLGLAAFLVGRSARGDETIPKVTLTEAGPNRSIPGGSTFYLSGAVEPEIVRVQAVVIRKGSTFLFRGNGPSCAQVAKEIALPAEYSGKNGLGYLDAGVRSWPSNSDYTALISAPWERKAAADATFDVLIPKEGSFFVTGQSYCLFAYRVRYRKKSETETAERMLVKHAKGLEACKALPEGERGGCEQTQNDELAKAARAAWPTLSPEMQGTINAAHEMIRGLQLAPERLAKLFEAWATTDATTRANAFTREPAMGLRLRVRPVSPGAQGPGEKQDASPVDPLGRATVTLLARNNGLHMNDAGPLRVPTYSSLTAKVQVGFVDILADRQRIRLHDATEGKPGASEIADVKTDALKLPGSDVTLRDLLEFAFGYVRIGEDKYVRPSETFARLKPLFQSRGAWTDDQRKTLREVRGRIEGLQAALRRTFVASAPGAPPTTWGTDASIEVDLGQWLRDSVAVPCNDDQLKKWGLSTAAPDSRCQPGTGWPNYPKSGQSPLSFIVDQLDSFEIQHDAWVEYAEKLAVITERTTAEPFAQPIEMNLDFTQDTWVFSYLTPIVGVAVPWSPSKRFNMPVVGVQLHLVPNPVDEPLWTNGSADWWRAFALEAAVATTNGPFGQDGRFRGWNSLPPVFLGVAVHLIPYTSISYGGTLLERRASTIAQEEPEAFWSSYVGLTVQANIPDMVSSLKGRHATTTASPTAGK